MLIYLILAVAFALAGAFIPSPQWLRVGFYVVAGFILLLALLALAGYVDGYPLVRSTRL
jgi:predicted membrane channel-forming protein YqfA (hemolysin III family)